MTTEPNDGGQALKERIVRDALLFLREHWRFPTTDELAKGQRRQLAAIEQLDSQGYLLVGVGFELVEPTLAGLFEFGGAEAEAERARFEKLLPSWRAAYHTDSKKSWSAEELAELAGVPVAEVYVSLLLFGLGLSLFVLRSDFRSNAGGFDARVFAFDEAVLSDEVIATRLAMRTENGEFGPTIRLRGLKVDGYRALEGFSTEFNPLTVIIGANASGKSSLFDLLAFVAYAAQNPLPPEIDPRSVGRSLFHLGSPERFSVMMAVDRGTPRVLRYSLQLSGPVGSPRVMSESLAFMHQNQDGSWLEAGRFLSFKEGKGTVRSALSMRAPLGNPAVSWTLPPNELALRRVLDPNLVPINNFQAYVAEWRFYSGFDVGMSSAIRRPVMSEPNPILKEDGANLSAVLFHLKSEHPEVWEELETHLRSAIPSFQSLTVKPRGGPGTVIGIWREVGVKGELTLADLSDGTLKFLCWATLCLSRKAPLICIDEPELGLHPRVLPVLAGLLRQAAADSQLLVATHSPYFLSQFSLEEIAVMKKVEGRAVFARPASNEALRREIEELGSGELARLHISDELEVRS